MLDVIMSDWAPPIISVLVGGIFASILIPRIQRRFETSVLYERRKLEILEAVAQHFPIYIANWRRLIQISRHESTNELSKEEMDRKQSFVEARNSARDVLWSDLNTARVYYTDDTWDLIEGFISWDGRSSVALLNDLPGIGEWEKWEQTILKAMKKEAINSKAGS